MNSVRKCNSVKKKVVFLALEISSAATTKTKIQPKSFYSLKNICPLTSFK